VRTAPEFPSGWLSPRGDLRPLVDGSGGRHAGSGRRQRVHRRLVPAPHHISEAVAGGAVLALVTHVMMPEAIEEAGSLIVLPTTAGFLTALYLALTEYPVRQ